MYFIKVMQKRSILVLKGNSVVLIATFPNLKKHNETEQKRLGLYQISAPAPAEIQPFLQIHKKSGSR